MACSTPQNAATSATQRAINGNDRCSHQRMNSAPYVTMYMVLSPFMSHHKVMDLIDSGCWLLVVLCGRRRRRRCWSGFIYNFQAAQVGHAADAHSARRTVRDSNAGVKRSSQPGHTMVMIMFQLRHWRTDGVTARPGLEARPAPAGACIAMQDRKFIAAPRYASSTALPTLASRLGSSRSHP